MTWFTAFGSVHPKIAGGLIGCEPPTGWVITVTQSEIETFAKGLVGLPDIPVVVWLKLTACVACAVL